MPAAFDKHGVDACTQERCIAQTCCARAASRADGALERITHNDNERMHATARMAYPRGAYRHALYE